MLADDGLPGEDLAMKLGLVLRRRQVAILVRRVIGAQIDSF
jgi:hypothetical protein